MKRFTWLMLGTAVVASGCDGCIRLEDYTLVPASDGGASGTSTGTSTSTGVGGQDVCGETGAAVMVALPATTEAFDDCTAGAGDGFDVLAFETTRGRCLARQRIALTSGPLPDMPPRVSVAFDDTTVIAGTLQGSTLELPNDCSSGAGIPVAAAGAVDAAWVAWLRLDADGLCTERVRVVSTDATGRLRVTGLRRTHGQTVVAGYLDGGGALRLDDATVSAPGGAFALRFSAQGALEPSPSFEGTGDDRFLGVGAIGTTSLVSGSLRYEDPGCHGCTGVSDVANPADACPMGTGGSGGTGGMMGQGGTGGSTNDAHNAALLAWPPGETCGRLGTHGRDGVLDDAQLGVHANGVQNLGECRGAFVGGAGRSTWPLDRLDDTTSLFDAGGPGSDAFIFGTRGSSTLDCVSGMGFDFSLRATPSIVDATAWGHRVVAARCRPQALASIFAVDAAGGRLDIHRCADGSCSEADASIPLASGADGQLVLLGADRDRVSWHGVLAPVAIPQTTLDGRVVGDGGDHLSADGRDRLYAIFTTTGPLQRVNFEDGFCEDLPQGAPAGTWLLALDPDGFSDRAMCRWAVFLRP